MRVVLFLLVLTVFECDTHSFRIHRHQQGAPPPPPPSGKYRVSPTTGVRIALPTPEQLQWQAQELGLLVCFNLATYLETDGCMGQMVPSVDLFAPTFLNTDNWAQTMVDFGAQYAVLVAKHACGFLMSPTNVTFSLNPSGQMISYNYTIGYSPAKGVDLLDEFIKSCQKRNISAGFYYTVATNSWLNVDGGFVLNRTLQPGQLNITQQTYDSIVLQQLSELWTKYGALDEIWFDGGYTASLKEPITALLNQLQPHAVIFNGEGLTKNPARWIGTEMGVAPDPNWSTGTGDGGGDPDSPIFNPAECDTTLQTRDRWFWSSEVTLRSLSEMIEVYHQTVGRNCMLMLDLAPDRRGLIPTDHAVLYKELGDFIRSCYGTSAQPSRRMTVDDSTVHVLKFDAPLTVDRSVIQEDQTQGQVIRAYVVDAQLANGTDWVTVAQGTSIGNKKIDIWQAGALLVSSVRVNVTKSVDTPVIKAFTVHLCA